MPIFLAVIALAVVLLIRAVGLYRKSFTVSWLQGVRACLGAYWLFAVAHSLFLTDRYTIQECLTTSQSFLWPGIIFSLAVMIANDLITEKKAEVERDRNTAT